MQEEDTVKANRICHSAAGLAAIHQGTQADVVLLREVAKSSPEKRQLPLSSPKAAAPRHEEGGAAQGAAVLPCHGAPVKAAGCFLHAGSPGDGDGERWALLWVWGSGPMRRMEIWPGHPTHGWRKHQPERQTGEERGERDQGKHGREKSQLLAGSPQSSSSQGARNS